MQFGGEEFVLTSARIASCPTRKVRVYIPMLKTFMSTKQKILVGYSEDEKLPQDRRFLYAYEEGGFIHLGCLKESKDKATKIYSELLKQINQQYGQD